MNVTRLFPVTFAVTFCATAQIGDVVKKDNISVHTVERGSMSIFASASGMLTSTQPPRATLRFDGNDGNCQPGRGARLAIGDNPRALAAQVEKQTDQGECEVKLVDKLPDGVALGTKAKALIVSRELNDVIFFGRPADSKPNSTATIFVVDDPSTARRVTVRYGAMSGPLIQVLAGLAPGDRVIVTDMSKWADLPQVRLE